jgi:hypothetical protein
MENELKAKPAAAVVFKKSLRFSFIALRAFSWPSGPNPKGRFTV